MSEWARHKAEAEMMRGTNHIMKLAQLKAKIKVGDEISTNTSTGKVFGKVTQIDPNGKGVWFDVEKGNEVINVFIEYDDIIINLLG
jgi:hypothetical protein